MSDEIFEIAKEIKLDKRVKVWDSLERLQQNGCPVKEIKDGIFEVSYLGNDFTFTSNGKVKPKGSKSWFKYPSNVKIETFLGFFSPKHYMDYQLTFGKYKNVSIKELIDSGEIGYLRWVSENVRTKYWKLEIALHEIFKNR